MPPRTLNRRALRDQNDAAEAVDSDDEIEGEEEDAPKPRVRKKKSNTAKTKAPAKPRARKKVSKVPSRMFARWAVFDNGLKRVALFEYTDRAGADAKLAHIRASKTGTFFVALVKDPYDPPAEPASVPIA